MQPHAYIITLTATENLSERLSWYRDQFHSRYYHELTRSLDRYGWTWEPFAASDGYGELEWNVPPRIGSKIAAHPGALGCLHSHARLWRLCVDRGAAITVLESDAVCLAPWQETALAPVTKIGYKFRGTERENRRTGLWSPGAVGYVITPLGAECLLGNLELHGPAEADKLIGSRIVDWQYGPRLFDINHASHAQSSTKNR